MDKTEMNEKTRGLMLAIEESLGEASIKETRKAMESEPAIDFDEVSSSDLLSLAYLKIEELLQEVDRLKSAVGSDNIA